MASAVFGESAPPTIPVNLHPKLCLRSQELIESVDACVVSIVRRARYGFLTFRSIDNGVNISSSKPAYALRTDLSSRIKRINPNWNEPSSDEIFDVSDDSFNLIYPVIPHHRPVASNWLSHVTDTLSPGRFQGNIA